MRKLCTLLAVAIAVSGCMVGPDYRRPLLTRRGPGGSRRRRPGTWSTRFGGSNSTTLSWMA